MSTTKLASQAPERSLDQRIDALARANEVRVSRAELKRALKRGDVDIKEVLAAPPAFLLTAKVLDVLLAVPGCGRVKSARYLQTCRIAQSKTVGGLSERQRAELVDELKR
jgi:hypothetical protein